MATTLKVLAAVHFYCRETEVCRRKRPCLLTDTDLQLTESVRSTADKVRGCIQLLVSLPPARFPSQPAPTLAEWASPCGYSRVPFDLSQDALWLGGPVNIKNETR